MAEAKINEIKNYKREFQNKYYDNSIFCSDIPEKIIILDDIKIFNKFIKLNLFLDKLSFIKEKRKDWWIYMQGGAKKLNNEDYLTIISYSC